MHPLPRSPTSSRRRPPRVRAELPVARRRDGRRVTGCRVEHRRADGQARGGHGGQLAVRGVDAGEVSLFLSSTLISIRMGNCTDVVFCLTLTGSSPMRRSVSTWWPRTGRAAKETRRRSRRGKFIFIAVCTSRLTSCFICLQARGAVEAAEEE